MSTLTTEKLIDEIEEPRTPSAAAAVLDAAATFVRQLEQIDRELRRSGSPLPSEADKHQVAARFDELFTRVDELAPAIPTGEIDATKTAFRALMGPWLLRSRFFWRSLMKPQGYAGDFRMIEWIYDIEGGTGDDPTQAAIVNCLDHTFRAIHSTASMWERRRWLADLVRTEIEARGSCSVLDVACGGARYLSDATRAATRPGEVALTLVDQDPSALHYAREVALRDVPASVRTVSTPVKRMFESLGGETFDTIISAGLFDYLPRDVAVLLLGGLTAALNPGGCLAITNFHVDDHSASIKDWAGDWRLIFRTDDEVRELFTANGLTPTLRRSTNGALAMAVARKDG